MRRAGKELRAAAPDSALRRGVRLRSCPTTNSERERGELNHEGVVSFYAVAEKTNYTMRTVRRPSIGESSTNRAAVMRVQRVR